MTTEKKLGGSLGEPPEALPCAECGVMIAPKPNPFAGSWWRPTVCSSCVDKERAAQAQAEAAARFEQAALALLTHAELEELRTLWGHQVRQHEVLATLSLAGGGRAGQRVSALLVGPSGTGKTTQINLWIASTLRRSIDQGQDPPHIVRYLEPELLREIQAADLAFSGDKTLLDRLKRAQVLILDEMGTSHPTGRGASMFHELIDARYRARLVTIFSSNFSMRELAQAYFVPERDGHPLYDERTLGRILDMCSYEQGYASFEEVYRTEAVRRSIYEY